MKFGKLLESQQTPEWSSKYVNYKFLRKSIKKYRIEIEALELNLREKVTPSISTINSDGFVVSQPMSRGSPPNGPSIRSSLSTLSLRNLIASASGGGQSGGSSDGITRISSNSEVNQYGDLSTIPEGADSNTGGTTLADIDLHSSKFLNRMSTLNEIQENLIKLFTEEMNKVNDFFRERETEAINRFNKIKDQIPLYIKSKKQHESESQNQNHNHSDNHSNNTNHVILVDESHPAHRTVHSEEEEEEEEEQHIMKSHNDHDDDDDSHPHDDNDNDILDEQNHNNAIKLKKIKSTFNTPEIVSHRIIGTLKDITEIVSTEAKHIISIGKKSNDTILKEQMREFYHYLILLKNFQVINYTAFVKILKKAEKNTHLSLSSKILSMIDQLPLKSSKKVEKIAKSLENVYSELFSQGNLRDARKQLRNSDRLNSNPTTSSFFTGLCTGWTSGILILIYYFIYSGEQTDFSRFSSVYNLYSALGLILLWTTVFGLDVMVWTKFNVNYSFIFEISQSKLNYFRIFQAATLLSVLWITSIGIYMWSSLEDDFPFPILIPPEYNPLVLAGIYLVLLCVPFNVLQFPTRKWFLNTIYRVVTAPMKSVRFKDFFMGDQLSSLVLMMVNLSQFFCFYTVDAYRPETDQVCLNRARYFNPFISAAPAWWRFLQCLRRYYDSRENVHLRNALKYFLSIVVVFFSTMDSFYSTNGWRSPLRIIWLIFGVSNSMYSYYWDIFMDWSILVPVKSSTPSGSERLINRFLPWKYQLRKKRMYTPTFIYYLAVYSNLGFRFTWTLSKSLPQLVKFLPSYKFTVIIGIVEILRRGQWNLYRLENEHLNNCGKFRVIREMPTLAFD